MPTDDLTLPAVAAPAVAAPASAAPDAATQWLDALPLQFSHFDADGFLLRCNAAFAAWRGADAASLRGKRLHDLLDADELERVRPYLREVLAGRAVQYTRDQLLDGVVRWLEVRLHPEVEHDCVRGFYCLDIDRTDRKQHAERTALLEQAAGVTFWSLDLRAGVLRSEQDWSDPRRGALPARYTIDELLGMLLDEDRDAVLRGLRPQSLRSGVSPRIEAGVRRRDGSVIWTRSQALVSRRDSRGDALELMGISADITAERTALRELRSSEQRFRTFASLSSDWFWELDAHGRFTSVSASSMRNRHVEAVRDAVLGRAWDAIDPALAQLPQWRALRTVMQRELPFHDLVLPYRAGIGNATRWWSLSATPVWAAHGVLDGWRGVARDITAQREAEDQLYAIAYTDGLTGLSNRRGFERLLRTALAQQPAGTLLFIDLDQFKQVNDSLGHGVGDRLLAEAAQRIQGARRAGDMVARFGGDEFLVFSRDDADCGLAERLRAELARPFRIDAHELRTTVSIGVACAPRDGSDIDALLSHADVALHEAKTQGRNRVQAFTPRLQARVQRRVQLEGELRAALDEDGFTLMLQPIAARGTDGVWRVECFEALARWSRPDGERVGPTEFVPILQDLGEMHRFGLLVMRRALRLLQQLRAGHGWRGGIAVNLSPAQLRAACVDCLRDELRATALDPALLTVELTENLQIMHSAEALETLDAIHDLGVRVSLDDFGVGFSSLEYVTRLPAAQLKIDRAFCHGVAADRHKAAVVTATLAMARSLGLQVVAEGVEHAADLAWVERAGCTLVQGWALWPALEPQDAAALLQRQRAAG